MQGDTPIIADAFSASTIVVTSHAGDAANDGAQRAIAVVDPATGRLVPVPVTNAQCAGAAVDS
jgi:hypothetical protein